MDAHKGMVSYLLAQEGAVEAWHPWAGLLQRGMVAAVMARLFLPAQRLFSALISVVEKRR